MVIKFIDPRDNSISIRSTQLINTLLTELALIATSDEDGGVAGLDSLLNKIKKINLAHQTIKYLRLSFSISRFPAVLNLFEQYSIPTAITYIEFHEQSCTLLNSLLLNKKCVKSVHIRHAYDAYDTYDETEEDHHLNSYVVSFITTLLTTDIYKFFCGEYYFLYNIPTLLESNKLIRLELDFATDNSSIIFNKILTILKADNKLRKLILTDIEISNDPNYDCINSELLVDLIQNNKHLEQVIIQDNELSSQFIQNMIQKINSTSIESTHPVIFKMFNCDLDMNNFLTAVNNFNINSLDVSSENFTFNNAQVLAQVLKTNTRLTVLNLRRCKVGPGLKVICQALIDNPANCLTDLNFEKCKSADDATYLVLAELIKLNKITKLNLERCGLPNVNSEVILPALLENKSLLQIKLDDNDVTNNETIIKEILLTRDRPLIIENLDKSEYPDLYQLMKLQLDNYNLSSKTLIQILQEYK